jgi:hypothetical protein
MPLLTSYSLAKHAPRTQRRLIDRRGELVARMQADYLARGAE